ncbi:MAG TPA: Si-specific NAD(P)(+) transhydrogenase [Actinomycetota bacterium]|nr:Si-specific NAD(P)(+) transhydrogenase [Actinomycetota bacterium]
MDQRSPRRYDLVVIGAGPAGEKAAAQAAYFGKRVAVVERAEVPGGTPATTGGIPTKTIREAALYLTGFRRREIYGVGLDLPPEISLERIRERAEDVVELGIATVQQNLERHGIELVRGEARLGAGRSVVVRGYDECTLVGDVVLIATGSRPYRPATIPFDDPAVDDSESILEVDRIPRSLVVVGGGPVGCEYASLLAALRVDVTLIDSGERLLPFMDAEISEVLAESFTQIGIRLVLGQGVATIGRTDERLAVTLADGEILNPERVLFAAGRAGNTDELGLTEAGIDRDARGRIVVDEHYRTSADGIYAAGDVIGPPALASVSMEQGRVAICHAFDIPFKESVDPTPPYGVYSIPEVAMVGMSEAAAAAEGIDHEVGRAWFAHNTRARIAGTTEGLVKLVFRRDDRTLVGCHIVGDIASELVHLPQAVLHAGGTIDRFIHTTFNVPTYSEAFKYAAYDGLQRLGGPSSPTTV